MPGGRPKIEFDDKDWKLLDIACQYKHHEIDIANLLEVSMDTVERRIREKHECSFAEYRNKRLSKTKHNLFAKQVEIAMAGNVTMLIWLGKQYLDQSDKQEIDQTIREIKIEIDSSDDKL